MALTQDQIAIQLVAQLRVLDPSASAEVGTPERKILDTVAQALAEGQVNLNLLGGALDLDSKFGSDLTAFVGLFGFGRQQGAFAIGFVTFSRAVPSPYNITIPRGTQVLGTVTINGNVQAITFQTTQAVTLTTGQTSVNAPIQAMVAGAQGNVAVNVIVQFANLGSPPLGITAVTNSVPTTNGADAETDPELKVRFRNTVFRNLAGTSDQFMALAVSTQFSTKANVVGPVSRYREYVQVPLTDDATVQNGAFTTPPPPNQAGDSILVYEPDLTVASYTIPSDGPGNGQSNQWTTTPSTNPYAKYVYTTVPYFLSAGGDSSAIFYRQDTDFTLNVPAVLVGDAYREIVGEIDLAAPSATQPNVTLSNVYTGVDPTVQLPRPYDVVLLEYSYLSAESRNDITRNIANCVDVFVNGRNPTTADAIIPASFPDTFNDNPIDKFYRQNFRRIGEPDTVPGDGNGFTALFWQPIVALPDLINVADNVFLLGTDYWAIEDITLLGNTVRSRNGIEWTSAAMSTVLGSGMTSITISGYTYDKNIVDLQAALDGNKQVTTDVLAHAATVRYFKLDLTLVYSPAIAPAAVNIAIETAITDYFAGQYFGSTILLSDILLTVRNVSGVQNVRWSNDVPNISDDLPQPNRVTECDINGSPRSPGVIHNTDFLLRDSELPRLPTQTLPGDTVPGLILRPRAQNTFQTN